MSERLPSLSVLMPNYNHGHYIGEALQTLLQQSIKPTEIIVIDDCSTDHSVAVVEAVARRDATVRLIRNPRNMGPHAAVDRGLAEAAGDYVYVMSSDDTVLPGFVEESLTVLAKYPAAGLCWSDNMTLDVRTNVYNRNQLRMCERPCYLSTKALVEAYRRGYIPCLSAHSSVMKRSALLEVGGMLPELHWHADGFVTLVIALRYGACYIPSTLICARILGESYMASGVRQRKLREETHRRMLQFLKLPRYRDVLPDVKTSGAYGFYGLPMLRLILADRTHWDYLTPSLVWRAFWFSGKRTLSAGAPLAARLAYHRSRHWYRHVIRPRFR